jgi:hypothetical protein
MKVKHILVAISIFFIGSAIFFVNPAIALQMPSLPGSVNRGNTPANSQTSFNWSGYDNFGTDYTAVGADWNVPEITSQTSSADTTWVGIGGAESNDLIQAGTQALVSNLGIVQYQAWYELLPGNSHPLPLLINSGDIVAFSIFQTAAGQWTISANNITTGQNYQLSVHYNSSMSSSEWIEEMPIKASGKSLPLDNFGDIHFTNAYAIKNGAVLSIAQTGADDLVMVDKADKPLATPSELGSEGNSFTITRLIDLPSLH